ncbi:unnamed protein product [Macrosiphum euphorbiae]|uniref:Uncharacterized protein n=1 Tax=Macrosiphum euphorbiae TaxID=13131 RepID=A0AAV0XLX0_9HEMI|nr:unnamed protein product [Macrosiphum euphorbiae]
MSWNLWKMYELSCERHVDRELHFVSAPYVVSELQVVKAPYVVSEPNVFSATARRQRSACRQRTTRRRLQCTVSRQRTTRT